MQYSTIKQRIAAKYQALSRLMDERMSRQWAAAEAVAYGWGGMRAVSEATGLSPHTIRKGSAELAEREADPGAPIPTRIRRPGGGRKCCTESDPELTMALELLVDPATCAGLPKQSMKPHWPSNWSTHAASLSSPPFWP